ncbi:hypothetical protein ABIC83_002741 [Roseateles asaccharophilus]|uniref:hypothetical protein n=1 Tax=Roseateles asaccharophilus TaxID=582607 RepID=UPI0038381E40
MSTKPYGLDNVRAEKAATGTEHGECLRDLWLLTRQTEDRHHEVVELADRCIAYARAGSPCDLDGHSIYPLRKFVNARWTMHSVKEMSGVFAAYVANGFIDVNASLGGTPALTWAILKANLHTSEHLVLHGADVAKATGGDDLVDYMDIHYGFDFAKMPGPQEKAEATARLLAAKMSWDIQRGVRADAPGALPGNHLRRLGI